jgi:hypothetical protein
MAKSIQLKKLFKLKFNIIQNNIPVVTAKDPIMKGVPYLGL